MKFFKTLLILATISVFIFACTNQPSGNGSNANTANFTANSPKNDLSDVSPAPTMDDLASGKKSYEEYCAKCHKSDGSGGVVVIEGRKMKADNLISDKMKKEPDAEYIKYMVEGIPDEGMPSFRDEMTDEQMKQVVKYIRDELQK